MLSIHSANRYESLADRLVERLGAGGGSPFDADTVIVPSAAVRRQLTLAIAQRRGVCANVAFAYLGQWLWLQLRAATGLGVASSPFAPDLLAWRIFAAFGDGSWTAAHPRLAAYLERADPLVRHALASRVAAAFDHLLTYRPEWVEAWSRGDAVDLGDAPPALCADAAWQAALWRRVAAEIGVAPPLPAFLRALEQGATGGWPALVHVFALPAIPPAHLALLQAIGRVTDVEIYALNPCREYWFEAVDPKRLAALAARGEDGHHEVGNRLLASWGKQAQAQLAMLVEAGGDGVVDDLDATPHPGSTLLARVHNTILDMTELEPGALTLAADDRSIEVHVCHSPVRELEALHDRLLDLFARPDAPAPGEILVVTPDLDASAPLVDAVFGTAPRDRHIPYTITGRARSTVNAPARALLALLSLAGSRCTVSDVFGVLSQAVIARRLGLDDDALDTVRRWLRDAGVHWALDAAHRDSLGLPPGARHSFADGLERLFLGYALPSPAAEPFAGRLPAGDAEGQGALALGALAHFVDGLAALRAATATPRPAPEWPALIEGAIEDFIAAADDELDDLLELRRAVQALAGVFAASGLVQPLPLALAREALAQRLDEPARGGVPTGTVTFSAMSSLRSLPYRVVCVLGLDDGAFPAPARTDEFDLIAQRPRRGDRLRRQDDRNLFLDLLLAARDRLHLSYVGRSVRDNTPLPPSVLVAELLDVLVPAIAADPADAASRAAARARLVVEHPLQPFAESLFRADADPRLASFHGDYAEAHRRRLGAVAPVPGDTFVDAGDDEDGDGGDDAAADTIAAPPFFTRPLPAPDASARDLPLERLVAFWCHPSRFLLRERLGITLPRVEEELADDEPFVPDIAARGALAQQLLPALLAGADMAAVQALARAGTAWPTGTLGEAWLAAELAQLRWHAAAVRELTVAPCVAPVAVRVAIDVAGEPWSVHAAWADLRPAGLVRHRYDELRASDLLEAWLHHLLLCAAAPVGVATVTTVVGRDERVVFARCEDPRAALADLLRRMAQGRCEPIAFFPKSAWEYVQGGESVSKALAKWRGGADATRAEQADPWNRLAWRGRPDPLVAGFDAFRDHALAVFGPLRAALQTEAG